MGCLLHLSPNFYDNVFLFAGLTSVGTLYNFNWLVHLVECIIIGDLHQSIGHCFIPLDP